MEGCFCFLDLGALRTICQFLNTQLTHSHRAELDSWALFLTLIMTHWVTLGKSFNLLWTSYLVIKGNSSIWLSWVLCPIIHISTHSERLLETLAAQITIWTFAPKSTQLRIYGFDSYSHHLKGCKLFLYRDFSKENSDFFL